MKENARAEAEHCRRQAEIRVHGERRETDVDAIEEREEVQHAQERNQAPRDLAQDRVARVVSEVICPVLAQAAHGSPHPTLSQRERERIAITSPGGRAPGEVIQYCGTFSRPGGADIDDSPDDPANRGTLSPDSGCREDPRLP